MSKFIDALPAEPIAREEALRAEANRLKDIEPAKFTKADVELTNEIVAELKRIEPVVKARKASTGAGELLAKSGVVRSAGSTTDPDDEGDPYGTDGPHSVRDVRRGDDIAGFSKAFSKAFKQAAPMVGGFGVQKALIPSGSVSVDYAAAIVREPAAEVNRLSSLIALLPVDAPSGAYLQQQTRSNSAAPVKVGDVKPQSSYSLAWEQWKLATIAHMSEPIPKQWLSDFAGLEQFLASELAYGIADAVDGFALNGGTAEDGTPVTGLLNSGLANVAFKTDALLSLRSALGVLDVAGVNANGIVLNPADWEAIETLKDSTGRYLLPLAPQQDVSRTLWGRPVVLLNGIPAGKGLVGDFRYVNLLSKGSYEITWAPYGSYPSDVTDPEAPRFELFERNQIRFRSEGRYGINIQSTAALRTVSLKSS
ncbi:phage major capsid protein [Leifsonia aquatica]|uniref:phage major capsid protein n=1 Tax=Leifsonia aquatica TaxID=144185 RepID=UPI0004690B0E|nr:phage major capsid protein [Leifsonia aquatica]